MKLFKHDEILAAKALELHERMKAKIDEHSLTFTFCSHCSSHGRYCVVADCSPEGRERLIAITESLKDLHHLLLSLQKKVKWKDKRRRDEEAMARVEESRRMVRERAEEYRLKEERENSLVEEVFEFVGDGKSWWNLEEDERKKKNVNGKFFSFLVGTTRLGLEFLVIFATIYYTSFKFARNRRKNEGERASSDDSRINKPNVVHLDVLCGRG